MDKNEVISRLSEIRSDLHKISFDHNHPSLIRYEVQEVNKKLSKVIDDIYYEDKIDITGKE